MRSLLIATGNKGKLREIVALLQDLPLEFVSMNDLVEISKYRNIKVDVEETGKTFKENAILKATTMGQRTGFLTLADDSGLEVNALGGRPGVRSARYVPGTDEDRYRTVLEEMKDVSDEKRGAQFRCVIAIYDPATEKIHTREGLVRGSILREPRGIAGFGYDPIFLCEALAKTMAELTLEEKNSVSHRGEALRKAKELLRAEYC